MTTILKELKAELAALPQVPFTITKVDPEGRTINFMLYTVTDKRINDAQTGIELYLIEDGCWHDWYPQDFEINHWFKPN